MNWLTKKLGQRTAVGYIFRVLLVLIGVIVLLLYWVYDTLRQALCLHFDIYPVDDEYVMCGKCGKEIWSPWGFR